MLKDGAVALYLVAFYSMEVAFLAILTYNLPHRGRCVTMNKLLCLHGRKYMAPTIFSVIFKLRATECDIYELKDQSSKHNVVR